ncbi:MAG: response regulator [Roseiflexaceae bacterium]|nr:response regulator [Roseiflexaceae bacterium]
MIRPTTLLIVDDHTEMRELLADLLKPLGFVLLFAANGQEALTRAVEHQPDLLLLDVMMPDMDGFEVCRRLREIPATKEMPIIMVTALDDQESRITGIEVGADDFISKPFNRAEMRARVRTIVRLNRYRHLNNERVRFEQLFVRSPDGIAAVDTNGMIRLVNPAMIRLTRATDPQALIGMQLRDLIAEPYQRECDILLLAASANLAYIERREMVLICADGTTLPAELTIGAFLWEDRPTAQVIVRDISERKRSEAAIQSLNADLLDAYDVTLEGWARALDLRDHETEGHSQRVTNLTVRLAHTFGLNPEVLVNIRRGALLHDIGKMGIPDQILRKPGPLSDEEWVIMRLHPGHAYELLRPIRFLQPALEIPYCHHERWDGKGYPRGLRGEEIPLAARIFAVVDVWDALTNDRPYRAALPVSEVRAYMAKQSNTHFDPQILEVFLHMMETVE